MRRENPEISFALNDAGELTIATRLQLIHLSVPHYQASQSSDHAGCDNARISLSFMPSVNHSPAKAVNSRAGWDHTTASNARSYRRHSHDTEDERSRLAHAPVFEAAL